MKAVGLLVAGLVMTACAQDSPKQQPPRAVAYERKPWPHVGIAMTDASGEWCAEFPADVSSSLETGRVVTIVFPGQGPVPSLGAHIVGTLPGECPAAFPQPRWEGYRAYRIVRTSSGPADLPVVALILTGDTGWMRTGNGAVRADLDADGTPEEARRCAADEGEHFTIWTLRGPGQQDRRSHEYYDWGAIVDPTCQPGEDGR